MAENSGIRWTHHTMNFWIGCVKVSEGCRHCYAETLVKNRMGKPGLWGPAKTHGRQQTAAANWAKLTTWNNRCKKYGIMDRVFALSLGDFFEPHPQLVPVRAEAWQIIRDTPYLLYMILTKRPEEIAGMLPDDWGNGYHNVELGTSVEDMRVAHRLSKLAAIPAACRFVSYEPALGPLHEADLTGIDQVLYGGESGPGFRNHDLAWPRAMKERCERDRIAFFYKQGAAPRTEMFQELDGERLEGYPTPRSMTHPQMFPGMTAEIREAMYRRVELDRSGKGTTSSAWLAENGPPPAVKKRDARRNEPALDL